MPERSKDWFKQAERDLDSAKAQLKDGFYEWACFISQQAGEKAVKSVYQKNNGEAWGHSISNLLKGLSEKIRVTDELMEAAKHLDKLYIPSRYPNGWAQGTPADYITKEDAENAVGNSEKILRFCKDLLAQSRKYYL